MMDTRPPEGISLALADEAATMALGARLARMPDVAMMLLRGDLGVGKTTLVRGLLRARGHAGAVKSPTYTLVEPYELVGGQVFHFDLYRLVDEDELDAMGFRDYLAADALCLVEWPERAPGLLGESDLDIDLVLDGEGRMATLVTRSRTLAAWLAAEFAQCRAYADLG